MKELKEASLYIIDDDYFEKYADSTWLSNKSGSRPHYYCIKDKNNVIWMIPLSSKVENVKKKIARVEEQRGEGKCIYYHIGIIAGKERAFKICDIFPVTEKYIIRNYEISGKPYTVKNDNLNRSIKSKAMKYLELVEKQAILEQRNIMEIKEKLLTEE